MTLATGQRSNRGAIRAFTLIELILVLALLVVITSLVAPAMSNFIRGRALDAEARRMLALLHAGQSRAVSEGMPMLIWIDEKHGAYGLEAETSGQNGDAKAEHLTLDDTLQIAVKGGAGSLATVRTLPAIRLLADGSVDEKSPPAVQLTDGAGVSLWLVLPRTRTGYEIKTTDK
jgi:type II secretion system protein H